MAKATKNKKRIPNYILGSVFILAGMNHFFVPKFYTMIMPPSLPAHLQLVYISGVLEILGGAGVLFPRTRRWSGWGLIALMFAVYPANIYMARNPDKFGNIAPPWALIVRLPLQFVLMGIIYWVAIRGQQAD